MRAILIMRLAMLLSMRTSSGECASARLAVYVARDPDTVRGADAIFISHERYAQKQSPSYLDVAPELVVEILSPNDAWSKVTQKLREYFAIGVRLIWVADPATRTVFAYRSITDVREFTAAGRAATAMMCCQALRCRWRSCSRTDPPVPSFPTRDKISAQAQTSAGGRRCRRRA